MLGTEEKGECYVCTVKPWKEMPKGLTSMYDTLSDTLKEYQCRGMISLEARVLKKKFYLQDPCMRFGSPPGELEMNMIKNLPDIFWYGAEGVLIEPEYDGKYGFMLNLHSDWADKHPLMIAYPEKYHKNIKFRYDSLFDGHTWILPQGAGPRVAAVVTNGNNLDDCFEEAKEISSQMKGIQLEAFTRSYPIIMEKIDKFKDWGIKF